MKLLHFLRKQEHINKDTKLIIPTEKVYFFIEKIPLNYSVVYSGSGQSISKKEPVSPCLILVELACTRRRQMDPDVQNVLLGTGIYGDVSE